VALEQLFEKAGIGPDDIDYYIPHQANKFMLERLRLRLGIPAEKFFCDMETTANTVSSTIPIAWEQALARRLIASAAGACRKARAAVGQTLCRNTRE
jgi:3-oxoacyl-[acyl-carrier-protein] synthase-3